MTENTLLKKLSRGASLLMLLTGAGGTDQARREASAQQ